MMMSSELEALIEENKAKFIIDAEELQARVDARVLNYSTVLPAVNLEDPIYLKVRKYYTNLQSMVIDSASRLNSGYTLDSPNSLVSGGGFIISYVKGEALKKKDLVLIKKQEKESYEAELEIKKAEFIKNLTQQQAVEIAAKAEKLALDNTTALQKQLSELLNSK
jgi:hypothetical protein